MVQFDRWTTSADSAAYRRGTGAWRASKTPFHTLPGMIGAQLFIFALASNRTPMHVRNTLIVLLFPLSAMAQEARNGPKAGIGFATQSVGQFFGSNGHFKLGPQVGWSFEFPITSQVGFLLEPMYIAKGSRTVNSYDKTRDLITLNYLEMPVMVKLSTNPDPQGLFLTGGLMYGYFLGGQQRHYEYGELKSKTKYAPEDTNRSEWSAGLGIGYEKGDWMWEFRAQSSMSVFSPTIPSHNVVYSAQVAWRLPTRSEKASR
jgi:hypothetical protein